MACLEGRSTYDSPAACTPVGRAVGINVMLVDLPRANALLDRRLRHEGFSLWLGDLELLGVCR